MNQEVHFDAEIRRAKFMMNRELEVGRCKQGLVYNMNLSTVDSHGKLIESAHSSDLILDSISPPKIVGKFHSFVSESADHSEDEASKSQFESPDQKTQTALHFNLEKRLVSLDAIKSEELHSLFETSDHHEHHEHLTVRCTPPNPTLKHLGKPSSNRIL